MFLTAFITLDLPQLLKRHHCGLRGEGVIKTSFQISETLQSFILIEMMCRIKRKWNRSLTLNAIEAFSHHHFSHHLFLKRGPQVWIDGAVQTVFAGYWWSSTNCVRRLFLLLKCLQAIFIVTVSSRFFFEVCFWGNSFKANNSSVNTVKLIDANFMILCFWYKIQTQALPMTSS